jgi:YidC/Oxa1 family membrane protein insertase
MLNQPIMSTLSRAEEIAAMQPFMDQLSYWPGPLCVRLLESTWEYAQCPWYQAIIGTTIAMRFAMTPIMIRSMRNNSRMAHMKPEMDKLGADFERNPNKSAMEEQMKHRARLQALFKKYDANPMVSLGMIFVQMPVFMGMFFGIRSMAEDNNVPSFAYQGPDLTHLLSTYGDFTNLTISDASFLLPIYCSLSFAAMIEMGADGMDPQQSRMIKIVMRGLALAMIPFSMTIPQGVFMYWCTNNTWSLFQTGLLKYKPLKAALGIWEPPKQLNNGGGSQDLMKMFNETMEKAKGVTEEELKIRKIKEEIPTAVYSSKPKTAAKAKAKSPSRESRGGKKKR